MNYYSYSSGAHRWTTPPYMYVHTGYQDHSPPSNPSMWQAGNGAGSAGNDQTFEMTVMPGPPQSVYSGATPPAHPNALQPYPASQSYVERAQALDKLVKDNISKLPNHRNMAVWTGVSAFIGSLVFLIPSVVKPWLTDGSHFNSNVVLEGLKAHHFWPLIAGGVLGLTGFIVGYRLQKGFLDRVKETVVVRSHGGEDWSTLHQDLGKISGNDPDAEHALQILNKTKQRFEITGRDMGESIGMGLLGAAGVLVLLGGLAGLILWAIAQGAGGGQAGNCVGCIGCEGCTGGRVDHSDRTRRSRTSNVEDPASLVTPAPRRLDSAGYVV